jgi:nucleoside-diphosphate-sugar epimerase
LVTGGTGFVGRAIVGELRRRGHDVVALVRDRDKARQVGLDSLGARLCDGDLEDSSSLERALRDCKVVVHAAALVDPAVAADERAVFRVNRDLAVEFAERARVAKARRFVFVSSIAAMGFWSGVATSKSPCRPRTVYGRAKLEAEQRLLPLAGGAFDVVVLRLPTVYGPGERYNVLTWARAVDRGIFRIIGGGHNIMPLCTTENAARCAEGAADGKLGSGVYLVADAERYSVLRIHRALLAALGRSEPLLRIPRAAAWTAGLANETVCALAPTLPKILSRARVRTLTADQPFDIRPLLDAGIELDAPLEAWVRATVEDYRKRGELFD